MSEGITTQLVIQWLVSMIGGGLAGSALSILYNRQIARRTALAKENGLIAALDGELKRSSLLCQHNAKLVAVSVAPFIHFPISSALKAAFEERHSYPRLAEFQQDLEWYTLGVVHVNELIDVYRLLVVRSSETTTAKGNRDDLRNKIANICEGKAVIEGVGPENFIYLPSFISSLSKKVERVRSSNA